MRQALNNDGALDMDVGQAFNAARQNYINYAASCPMPTSLEFMGRSFAIPSDKVCAIGAFIRLIVHAAAYLAALRILSRGIV